MTYADATQELTDLANYTVARYRVTDSQRTRNVLAQALAEMRSDAETERALWDQAFGSIDSLAS